MFTGLVELTAGGAGIDEATGTLLAGLLEAGDEAAGALVAGLLEAGDEAAGALLDGLLAGVTEVPMTDEEEVLG